MADYIAHLARDENPLLTVCGEPWQGWQAAEDYTLTPGHLTVAPHVPPRPHVDPVRQCQACARALR